LNAEDAGDAERSSANPASSAFKFVLTDSSSNGSSNFVIPLKVLVRLLPVGEASC
jgi:hypothetical protein